MRLAPTPSRRLPTRPWRKASGKRLRANVDRARSEGVFAASLILPRLAVPKWLRSPSLSLGSACVTFLWHTHSAEMDCQRRGYNLPLRGLSLSGRRRPCGARCTFGIVTP